jgi:phospholipid/cholesterol/gamma-HCH transport system substrate-binding protein
VVSFNRTMAAFASQEGNLRATLRDLPPTLDVADTTFDSLNRAFPPTRAFAREVLPGVRLSAATIDASFPFVVQLRRLVSEPELRGLVSVLRPTTRDLSALVDATTTLLPQVNAVNQCMIGNVLPTIKTTLQDGNLSTGVPIYKELSQGLVAAAGESQNFDGNGQYVRFGVQGGANQVSTGTTNFGGKQLFGNVNLRPLGTRPIYPGKEPPYRPDVRCASQKRPNLSSEAGPPSERVIGRSTSETIASAAARSATASSTTPASPTTPAPTTASPRTPSTDSGTAGGTRKGAR